MTKDDRDIVSAVQGALAERVGKDRFEMWFGANACFRLSGDMLTVGAANQFYVDWLRTNFRAPLEDACRDVQGRKLSLRLEVDPALAAAGSRAIASADASPTLRIAAARPPAVERSLCDLNPPDAALPRRRRFADLESFVVGDSNRLAHAAACGMIDRPADVSPLVLWGPTSVGKTHLLEGIWTGVRRRQPSLQALYMTAEQFTSQFVEACRGGGAPNFRRKFRGAQLLLIDDLSFFSGKKQTLVELLVTVDSFLREGRQLVFSADRAPAEMPELGPELMTRLQVGLACRLDPPDTATRKAILKQIAHSMQIVVPDDVQDLVAARAATHARELAGALKRLHATSLASGQPISLPLAETALADMLQPRGKCVRLSDIQSAICDVFRLPADSLQSNRRGKQVSHPRMLAMWLARKHTRAAYAEIGQYFGQRSHSTVISAHKKVNGWMEGAGTIPFEGNSLPIADAVRQVEASLRAG